MITQDDIYGILCLDPSNDEKLEYSNQPHRSHGLFNQEQSQQVNNHFQSLDQILVSMPTNPEIKKKNQKNEEQNGISDSINSQNPLDSAKPRLTRQIIIQQITKRKKQRCKKGERFETNNIGKHLKSLTNKLFLAFEDAGILNSQELVSVRNFKSTNGSKKDFQVLFMNKRLLQKFFEFFSMNNSIKEILASSKMSFRSKLMMIKHLEKLRLVGYDHSSTWKDLTKL